MNKIPRIINKPKKTKPTMIVLIFIEHTIITRFKITY